MNAIIWWLESPWQLRALVFILSFFVCFVGPWLHSQSLLTSRLAARNPLEEKRETVSAPKEGTVQQAEEQANVPAPQERVPVQEKAPLQPVPASAEEKGLTEQVHPQAGRPVHAAQLPAAVAVREEQSSAPATHEQVPAPAQVAPLPVEAKTADHHEQVPAPAQVPVEIAPAPVMQEAAAPALVAPLPAEAKAPALHEQMPAPVQAPAEEAPAPSEPMARPAQEQAAVHAPAPAATSKAQLAGGFDIINQSASVNPVPAGSPVEKQELAASTEKGGSADVEVYVLSNKAGWGLRRSNRVVDQSNGRAELSAVLDSDAFAKAAARFDTVACAGLGSRDTALSTQEIMRLIDNRAVQLCGIIARKPYVSMNTKLYGLPLGQQLDTAPSEKERAQKSLIIIGIRNAKGDLADAAVQKKMVSEIIRGGKIANFPLGNYSEVASGKELRYIEVRGGKGTYKNRPIKSSIVKPGYASQHEGHRQSFSAHHKRCGASVGSRTLPMAHKKVSRSKANAEASVSRTHRGCGIFDFPF